MSPKYSRDWGIKKFPAGRDSPFFEVQYGCFTFRQSNYYAQKLIMIEFEQAFIAISFALFINSAVTLFLSKILETLFVF